MLASNALTTIENVQAFSHGVGEPIPAEHALNLEFTINAVSESIERFCEREFQKQTWTDERQTGIKDQTLLWPRQQPIISLTSVTLDGDAITEGTESNQWRKHKTSDGTWVALFREETFQSEPYGIGLTYLAGYTLPGNSGRDLPFDLEQTAIKLTLQEYLHRGRQGVSNESFAGLTLSLDRWGVDIVKTLTRYRIPRY